MGKEYKYKCKDLGKYKDCKGEVVISAKVYKLMAERGESLPERCETCKEKHRTGKRETRQAYFHVDLAMDEVVSFNYCAAAYTAHHERNRQEVIHKPELDGMKIRITDEHIKELYEKLDKHQVVILASPTGTGKSVYVLARLLEAPENYDSEFVETLIRQGQLSQTQPLAEATKRIPNTVSKRLIAESGPGTMATVGFRHSGEEAYSQHNIGIVVTDGSLKNWMRDGHLGQYSLIMVDEAHKRSVNIDSLLTLLQYKLPLYPHLKVIIASATINIEQFQKAFENQGISTDVFDLSKTLEDQINYQVHYWKGGAVKNCDCWLCRDEQLRENFWKKKEMPPEEAQLPEVVSSFVMEILKNTERGGILAFLTGQAVIERTGDLIKERIKNDPQLRGKVPVLPIYSRLGSEEVSRRFENPEKKRRILLTTDIAETSHTLDDILYVIESGYIKQYQWDPQDMTSSLPTIRHSQAGCLQRFGRVGRTQKGYVYCLYSNAEFKNQFKIQTTPEIFRSPVDDTLLTVKAAGITETPSFIGAPDNHIKFNMEIKRSLSSISDGGYADKTGNITDEGLDIFRVPLAPQKKALLDLADEQGCLVEMMTFLSMLETGKNDARTGAEIFNVNNGLLVWDKRWTAETKMHVWRIHQALKLGCVDDLDFILKLAVCYLDGKQSGKEKQWALQNFVNLPVLEKVFESQKKLAKIFLAKTEERGMRTINLTMVSKMRLILANIFNGCKVRVKRRENKIVYERVGAEDGVCGIIPELCVGNWQEGDEAFLITVTKKKNILDGQQKLISHACALVKLESSQSALRKDSFLDQKIFVGSEISVVDGGKNFFIGKVLYAPPQINVNYDKKLDFAVLMDDYLRKDYQPSVTFSHEEAKIKFSEISDSVSCIWQDERKSLKAKLTGWVMKDGSPCAVVAPTDERRVIQKIKQENRVKVKIVKVFKGPEDEKGWVLAQTEEGVDLPVETSDLCFSFSYKTFLIYGLKQLEDRWLELSVKRFTVSGRPVLSNISRIVSELQSIKQRVDQEGMVELEAIIDRIDINRKKIIVFVIDDNGTILTFSAWERSMLEKFKIGDKVLVRISLRDKGQCYDYQDLEDYQIESLPKDWADKYDKEDRRLAFPYFLDEEKLKDFEVEGSVKERMIKKSWGFGFNARILHVVVEKGNTDGASEV